MTENNTAPAVDAGDEGLTADEKAYFESGGEVLPKSATEPAKEEAKATDPVDAPNEKPDDLTTKGRDDRSDDDDQEDGSPQQESRKIDYHVLKKERERRQKLEATLAAQDARYRDEMARMNERLMAIIQQSNQPQQPVQQEPEPPAVPDPEQDIFGATKFAIEKLKQLEERERIAQQQRALEEQRALQAAQNRQKATAYENAVISKYNELGQERAKVDPEFESAYRFAREKRVSQLVRDEGFTPEQAKVQVTREEFEMAARTLQRGQDPTERIQRYAMDMGWKPGSKAEDKPAGKLEQIANGQAANKTLSNVGSPGNGRSVGQTALLDMSDKEFAAWLKKAGPDGFRAAAARP